jgi:hypothetical protein
MADESVVIPFHQPPSKHRAKTGAERAKAYRRRKRQQAGTVAVVESESQPSIKPPETLVPEPATIEPAVSQVLTETSRPPDPVTSRRQVAPLVLSTAAFALAAAGITMSKTRRSVSAFCCREAFCLLE